MNHLYIIEFRVKGGKAKGGKWEIFDRDGSFYREQSEMGIERNEPLHPDCEFRISKYQRVEES